MVNLEMDDTSPPSLDSNNTGGDSQHVKAPANDKAPRVQYSIPGVLHFIQHEWTRFEMERVQWEVERAELQARIAFLQGERKGQENLKNDLIRRIKMLEYALKQERLKYQKLKYGTETDQPDLSLDPSASEADAFTMAADPITQPSSNAGWRQGRQLLRQYLQEIGYADALLDVRALRVRQLVGNNAVEELDSRIADVPNRYQLDPSLNFPLNSMTNAETDRQSEAAAKSETSVVSKPNNVNLSSDQDENCDDDQVEKSAWNQQRKSNADNAATLDEQQATVDEAFDFLSPEVQKGAEGAAMDQEWSVDQQLISRMKEQYKIEAKQHKKQSGRFNLKGDDVQSMLESLADRSLNKYMENCRGLEPNMEGENRTHMVSAPEGAGYDMGELALIGKMTEMDNINYDISSATNASDVFRKTWENRCNLRSHFDSVRAMGFHPVEPVLITASEDCTMKLWNIQKGCGLNKKGTINDLEPVYTFRSHTRPILCLCTSPTGDSCYSGSMDGTIKCWMMPSPNIDPFDNYDPSVHMETLCGHTDSVWSVTFHASDNRLMSASADGLVKLWEPGTASPFLKDYSPETDEGVPTSVDFVNTDPQQVLVSYSSGAAFIFDIETGKTVLSFDSKEQHKSNGKGQINQIVSHPTLPITITAHDDRFIRFFDNNTGKLADSIPAHLDSVTCLSVDPNGLYLLSGSHDCSIRLWNLEQGKQCIQEITAHRKKFDESVFGVAFHPSRPFLASGGADGIAKVFQPV